MFIEWAETKIKYFKRRKYTRTIGRNYDKKFPAPFKFDRDKNFK